VGHAADRPHALAEAPQHQPRRRCRPPGRSPGGSRGRLRPSFASSSVWARPATSRASIKTVAEWFPKKERAFATGSSTRATNVGALLRPPSRSPGSPCTWDGDGPSWPPGWSAFLWPPGGCAPTTLPRATRVSPRPSSRTIRSDPPERGQAVPGAKLIAIASPGPSPRQVHDRPIWCSTSSGSPTSSTGTTASTEIDRPARGDDLSHRGRGQHRWAVALLELH
jgi:hypothetical protein